MIFSVETSVSATHHPAVRHWELYEQTDKPVIIIGKTTLVQCAYTARWHVHRKAAEKPDQLQKGMRQDESVGDAQTWCCARKSRARFGVLSGAVAACDVWPQVRVRLLAPGWISSTSNWCGRDGRRSVLTVRALIPRALR